MTKVKIPAGWCPKCSKEALDKVDLEQEATEKVAMLKRALPVAGALGGRDAALAEACYQLDLPVPPDMQRQELTKENARLLLAEIMRRYGGMLMNMLENSRLGEEFIYRHKRREGMYEEERRRYEEMTRRRPPTTMGFDPGKEVKPVEKFYYVPEYRVKENKR